MVGSGRTLSGLSSRVAAVGTGALLDVERTLSCSSKKYHVSFIPLLNVLSNCRNVPLRLICEDIHPSQLSSSLSLELLLRYDILQILTSSFLSVENEIQDWWCVLTASSAERVRLVVTLTKAGGTLRYSTLSVFVSFFLRGYRSWWSERKKCRYIDVLILNQGSKQAEEKISKLSCEKFNIRMQRENAPGFHWRGVCRCRRRSVVAAIAKFDWRTNLVA